MESTTGSTVITVTATVNAPLHKVWAYWTSPAHIMQWNQASPDWHTPHAENDLRNGGRFKSTMAAKDGSVSFDFEGEHTLVIDQQQIDSLLGDGRRMSVTFAAQGDVTLVTEQFEAETENSIELQQGGWQAILDSFKAHTEAN